MIKSVTETSDETLNESATIVPEKTTHDIFDGNKKKATPKMYKGQTHIPRDLYLFEDFDFDTFFVMYLNEITPHTVTTNLSTSSSIPPQTTTTKAMRGAKDRTIILNKAKYLQDAVIRMASRTHDEKPFTINANILRKVIGADYRPMLDTLSKMSLIKLGGNTNRTAYYKVGQYSTMYTIPKGTHIITEPLTNYKIIQYKKKTMVLVKELHEKVVLPKIIKKFGQSFLNSYLRSLRKIIIENFKGLTEYIKTRIQQNPDTAPYYNYIIQELLRTDKTIYKMDDSHRLYHVLSNTDRNIKPFLNIAISLDCNNSHPLLFNHFIFLKHGIPTDSAYTIIKYLKSQNNYIYHNDGKNLRKTLIDNKIEINEVAKMRDDELEYIYKTSQGLIWDEFCDMYPDLERKEVKVNMFQGVFYSHSPVTERWNEYASEFKNLYPTVYKLIGDWKRKKNRGQVVNYMRDHHLPVDKGTASLSVAMMALESEIFTTILKRLYAKRWDAIHIHDCITSTPLRIIYFFSLFSIGVSGVN